MTDHLDANKSQKHALPELPAVRIEYPAFGGPGGGPGLSVPVLSLQPRGRVSVGASSPLGLPDVLSYEYVVPDLHSFVRAEYVSPPAGFAHALFKTATVEVLLMISVPTMTSTIDPAHVVTKKSVRFQPGAAQTVSDSGSMGVNLPRTTDGADTLWALVICAKTAWHGAAPTQPKPLIVGICPIPVIGRINTQLHPAPA